LDTILMQTIPSKRGKGALAGSWTMVTES